MPHDRPWWPYVLVFAFAVLIRLPIAFSYEPMVFPDTGTYVTAAKELISGEFSVGQGRRTPGYPLVFAALGGNGQAVMLLQLAGGIAMSLLACWLVLHLGGAAGWGVAAGLAQALNLQQVFVEGALATEALSALSVIASLALLVALCTRLRGGQWPWLGLLGLGVLCSYAMFVRPQFLCLLVVAPLAVVWAAAGGHWPRWRHLLPGVLVLAPAVLLVGAWGAVMQAKTGYFTLSNQSGFGMVNHTIDYIEQAPPEYAAARDVLLRVREQRMAEVGHSRNTIWYAWPEIQRATGWSLPEASRQLQTMCRQMFIADPWRYARSVASAWVDFWTVPIFWAPEQVRPPALRSAAEGAWWVQHKLLRVANLAFVLLVAGVLVWPALRRRVAWDLALSAITATVLMSSLIQALADQGASSRYHLPTQTLVVVVLVVAAARAFSRRPLPG